MNPYEVILSLKQATDARDWSLVAQLVAHMEDEFGPVDTAECVGLCEGCDSEPVTVPFAFIWSAHAAVA